MQETILQGTRWPGMRQRVYNRRKKREEMIKKWMERAMEKESQVGHATGMPSS